MAKKKVEVKSEKDVIDSEFELRVQNAKGLSVEDKEKILKNCK